jgi:hypothetical protein
LGEVKQICRSNSGKGAGPRNFQFQYPLFYMKVENHKENKKSGFAKQVHKFRSHEKCYLCVLETGEK